MEKNQNKLKNSHRTSPKTTWRRTVEIEAKDEEKTLGELKGLARNQVRWGSFVTALSPPSRYRKK